MPRQARLDRSGIPQHGVQHGNNRPPGFLDDADRAYYLNLPCRSLLAAGCALHARMLMSSHAHLPVSPVCTGSVSQTMQKSGRQHVRLFKRLKVNLTPFFGFYKGMSGAGFATKGRADMADTTLSTTTERKPRRACHWAGAAGGS